MPVCFLYHSLYPNMSFDYIYTTSHLSRLLDSLDGLHHGCFQRLVLVVPIFCLHLRDFRLKRRGRQRDISRPAKAARSSRLSPCERAVNLKADIRY